MEEAFTLCEDRSCNTNECKVYPWDAAIASYIWSTPILGYKPYSMIMTTIRVSCSMALPKSFHCVIFRTCL